MIFLGAHKQGEMTKRNPLPDHNYEQFLELANRSHLVNYLHQSDKSPLFLDQINSEASPTNYKSDRPDPQDHRHLVV